ncbi:MAG: GNAT family N-acetyltransferase [Clostridium sp.]|jgi:predicted acetyltransferase|nr:GNAT family N-acetyltransferase [Clostridium sp.]
MNLELVKGSMKYKAQIIEMVEEWTAYNDSHDANTSPWSIFKNDVHEFDFYLEHLELIEAKDDLVPDSTYFCLDRDRDRMVGAVNIRHYLNDYLLAYGGHIGDGIRPSERKKGYGTAMMGLALKECLKLGIKKVLVVCSRNNIGSAKTIIKNGGILENQVETEGDLMQRYWIELPQQEKNRKIVRRAAECLKKRK